MPEFLKRKYEESLKNGDGVITENEIYIAFENGWITEAEKSEILSLAY